MARSDLFYFLLTIPLTPHKHLWVASGVAQQWDFCVIRVMRCVQTQKEQRNPPAGCLKSLASAHKARPPELQQTLNLMAANVHIVIHLEPAAAAADADANKQYSFIALHLTPHHQPPLFTTAYSWSLFSEHCHPESKPPRRSPPSAHGVTACFVLSAEVSIVRGSLA